MNRPTLRQLEYAVAIADHAHFGNAAAAVHISQPGLSSQIKELERRLGVTLFERSRRGIRLTVTGEAVIQRSRHILGLVDDLQRLTSRHRGTVTGRFVVAAIPTIAPYLLPVLARTLRRTWSEVHLELTERQTVPMVAAVEAGEIDMGLLAVPYDTGALRIRTLAEEPFLLAMPEGHRLSGVSPLAVSVLSNLQVLLLEEGHCLRDHARSVCDIAGKVEHSEVRATSLATLIQMVAGGTGVTLLPAGAAAIEARSGSGITTRPFREPTPGRTIALVWRDSDPRQDLYEALSDEIAGLVSSVVSNVASSVVSSLARGAAAGSAGYRTSRSGRAGSEP